MSASCESALPSFPHITKECRQDSHAESGAEVEQGCQHDGPGGWHEYLRERDAHAEECRGAEAVERPGYLSVAVGQRRLAQPTPRRS